MQYITDINQINTGDTLLVHTSNKRILPRWIHYFQKKKDDLGGRFNHAGIFWWCYDELMIIEAEKQGITPTPFANYLNDKIYIELMCLKPTFPVDGVEYGKFMLPFAGRTKYDKLGLLSELIKFRALEEGKKVWIGQRYFNKKKFMCGEWVGYVYNHFNSGMFRPSNCSPVDLYLNDKFEHHLIIKSLIKN